jgi:hypothetical protein
MCSVDEIQRLNGQGMLKTKILFGGQGLTVEEEDEPLPSKMETLELKEN